MNGNFGNGVFNSTLIETDLEGNLANNGEMPFWLRDIIERAFSASGIRINRKIASKDAIASLQAVDTADLAGDSCPICYDAYVFEKNKKKKGNPEGSAEEQSDHDNEFDHIVHLTARFGVSIPTQRESKRFHDPSLFLPVDYAANRHIRFPPGHLNTRIPVTQSEMFPALKSDTSTIPDTTNCEHKPVSMPHCGHVFGKPCIIEWLNGHVSCPLCRKEVEALKDTDPLTKKIATIKQNCNFVYCVDSNELITHIAKFSTDVFNPPRKTMNPTVTPLTDMSVPQSWAAPSYPPNAVWGCLSSSVDPPLVMTRKFPLSHFGREPSGFPITSMIASSSINRPLQPTNTSINTPSNFSSRATRRASEQEQPGSTPRSRSSSRSEPSSPSRAI